MAGIRIIHRDGTPVLHSTIWVDPKEVPVVFLVLKDGAMALAHPDYIGETLYSVNNGDLTPEEAWDHLMIKMPDMDYPVSCHVEVTQAEGKSTAEFRTGSRAGIVRYRMEI